MTECTICLRKFGNTALNSDNEKIQLTSAVRIVVHVKE